MMKRHIKDHLMCFCTKEGSCTLPFHGMSNPQQVDASNTMDPVSSVMGDVQMVQNEEQERNPLQKRERKRTSKVWSEFSIVTIDGVKKAKCNYCQAKLAMNSQGSTTQFRRHMDHCPVRLTSVNKQQLLTTQPLGANDFGGGLGGTITTYRYDKEKVRECLAKMIIVHEYPFRMVEHEFFSSFCKTLNPRYDQVSRITIRNDCMKLYAMEKTKLKLFFESIERLSLTADLWTSNQNIGYLCLTGHFLDSDWKLQKRILNFCALAPPHTGVAIADCIFQCLNEWGIESKVSTITLDNASSNDVAVRNLKDNFTLQGKLFFHGKIFHVRCCAHILNLMVQDGLNEIKEVIENVRESVKYLKMSTSRLHKFTEIAKQLQLPTSRRLILDVPTRWNSTFYMLESALVFKEVFRRYKERDPYYHWLPSMLDWEKAHELCKFLEAFNDATHVFSGTSYPTSNLFLPEVWKIKQILYQVPDDCMPYIKNMVVRMREKFDKYWGDCNLLMAMAAVLDPRYKMKLIEFCYPKIYTAYESEKHIEILRASLYELYHEYVIVGDGNNAKSSGIQNESFMDTSDGSFRTKNKGRSEFDIWAQELDVILPAKSDLDIYLEEGRYICKGDSNVEFSALEWWKENTLKFRFLSNMARDILSIPVSTVASESAFSAGGRVLDQYRSSLKPETVQALVCTGDWLRNTWGIRNSRELDEESMQEICLE